MDRFMRRFRARWCRTHIRVTVVLAASAGLAPWAMAAGPAITEFPIPIPTASSLPQGITAGPDGNLWFTEAIGNKIGRITPAAVATIAVYRESTGQWFILRPTGRTTQVGWGCPPCGNRPVPAKY